jgi:hypothetical protein
MTKHDQNWIFVIWVLAITFLLAPCFWARAAEPTADKPPTCEENAVHIATVKKELVRIANLQDKTTDAEWLVYGTEAQFLLKMQAMLQHWREVNHCDV